MARLVEKFLGDIRVLGYSVGGEESVIAVPEFNVCFDIGRAPRDVIAIDNICLTHGHMDHAAGIAYYLSQRAFLGIAPGQVIVHRGLAQAIQRLMDVWSDIEGHPSPGRILGVEHLEDVPIRRGLVVRPFDVNHSGHALGFSLIEQRHKLKPELQGKTGPELVALKKQGIAIDENIEVSILTCSGDTALGRFLDLPFVRNTQALLVECTFYERDHRQRASAGRHIHVDDLPRVLAAVPHARVLLTHVSRRSDMRFAKKMIARVLSPSDQERVAFLMDRPPRSATSGAGGTHLEAPPAPARE